MLLAQPRPLLAQVVHHPVVDGDQVVDFGLAHFEEARRELLFADQPQSLGGETEMPEQVPADLDADRHRGDESEFDGEQPQRVPAQQDEGERGEDRDESTTR